MEVDFVIPDVVQDLPLCIDPFLLFRSADPELRELHEKIIGVFNFGIDLYRTGRRDELARIIDFPEANEIGFGYSDGRIAGRGLGPTMERNLSELLGRVGEIQDRGIRHIEELQLLTVGIGPDLVSDTVAHLLKSYLVRYTVEQCLLHGIPLAPAAPLEHYFDFEQREWLDGYFDLPLNPRTQAPILLVPRRIVRLLPWINYDDYQRHEFRSFLRPTRPASDGPRRRSKPPEALPTKPNVVELTRQNLTLLDRYVARKEREGGGARPALPPSRGEVNELEVTAARLLADLAAIPTGRATAGAYQNQVLRILNFVFAPELTDGKIEEATFLGTERRDIIFTNESTDSFWAYIRGTHNAFLQMFECKNTNDLEPGDLNQSATYLGARLGTFGVVVTRTPATDSVLRKTYSIHNDSEGTSRKIILVLSDEDLRSLVERRARDSRPSQVVQQLYREFRLRCQ